MLTYKRFVSCSWRVYLIWYLKSPSKVLEGIVVIFQFLEKIENEKALKNNCMQIFKRDFVIFKHKYYIIPNMGAELMRPLSIVVILKSQAAVGMMKPVLVMQNAVFI